MSTPIGPSTPVVLGGGIPNTLPANFYSPVPGTVIPVQAVFFDSTQNLWAASPNNEAILVMQSNGNVVLYGVFGPNPTPAQGAKLQLTPLWATNTNGKNPQVFIVQPDGNIVISAGGKAIWASGPTISGGFSCAGLSVQDDGNLVLYQYYSIWGSGSFI